MAKRKFELVADSCIEVLGVKLFRIRALVSFGSVTKGDNRPAEPRHKPVPNCPQDDQGNAGETEE